jgi:general stress protein YciG
VIKLPKVKNISKKGKGWRGDSKRHAQVGRLGGQATARTHDETFYSQIGRLGGRVSPGNFANDPKRAREAGRIGGKARSKKNRKSV